MPAAPLAPTLSPERFAGLMARLGPFERAPHLAVAVSGGPDSLALALLLAEWAGSRNGRLDALTVDHRLRAESGAEAEQVARWLAHLPGVTHRILAWSDEKPAAGIQAAARAARYRLLAEYCRARAILHLCVAHHRDDQTETHRLRAGHGSGSIGLAGMSAIRPLDGVRLLRPLLGVAKAELLALLTARAQPWIEDPSNRNPAFERVRLRATAESATDAQDAAALHRLGLERQRVEAEAASLLAESLLLYPSGWAELDLDAIAAGERAGRLAFGWVLQCLGGNDYPVSDQRRGEALGRLGADSGADFTLGGCHLRRRGQHVEVHRDWGAIRQRIPAEPGLRALWDGRFEVTLLPESPPLSGLTIARLGEAGLRQLGRLGHGLAGCGIPEPARKALPALWQGDRLIAAPLLGFGGGLQARFRPARGAASGGFTVA
ncbi:tRNA lysidine(34) synthetase TilS [Dongia sedimenti]|uniref:tRNA(Ile)-lysidine synthase n=1 Tax=Dongia sedimenti TaxID=3064282 RepID=A0ABU0YIG9_9PROT|nr:tRNA lysidine(34) synthetase TilS [Rhodospirillaceae bacterium R-7]